MHDILYTDMEKTGFIWAKIRDIYRARALARMCGDGKMKINGKETNFYDIEERLWWQVHGKLTSQKSSRSASLCWLLICVWRGFVAC